MSKLCCLQLAAYLCFALAACASDLTSSLAADGGQLTRGQEGELCGSDAQCQSQLRCRVADRFLDGKGGETRVSVCARACDPTHHVCAASEVCASPLGEVAQALCLDVKRTLFEPCGAADTSYCGPTEYRCLALDPNAITQGVCVQPCVLPGSMQTGAPCPVGMVCRDDIHNPDYGLCMTPVARGQACGLALGMTCADGDLCIVKAGTARCYEACAADRACAGSATCRPLLDDRGSYCE